MSGGRNEGEIVKAFVVDKYRKKGALQLVNMPENCRRTMF
jgi:hypothetical protein